MRCEDIPAKSFDYLAGALGEAERREVESHLVSCSACRVEFDGLSQTWMKLGELPAMAPDSAAMRARFKTLLVESSTPMPAMSLTDRPALKRLSDTVREFGDGDHQGIASETYQPGARFVRNTLGGWIRRHAGIRPALQACVALLLVLVGIQVGRQTVPPRSAEVHELSQEVGELRQMVILSLMQQQSAVERLKGVNWSNQLDRPSNDIVAALIDSLMHDPNVNVRMASIDALKRFAERENVKAATLQALSSQTSPLVQMALIDFMVETRDRGSIDEMRRLSSDHSVDQTVRSRAVWGIDQLEST